MRRLESGGKADDVGAGDNTRRIPAEGNVDHGQTELAEGDEAVGKEGAAEGIHPVDPSIDGMSTCKPARRPDEAGAKGVAMREAKPQEVIFRLAFDARPAAAAFFGGVGAGAGDICKDQVGVQAVNRRCKVEGEGIGEPIILVGSHPDR